METDKLTISHKIAIFAILTAAVMSVMAPIFVYQYKVSTCAWAHAERYKGLGATLEPREMEGRCHALVNGAQDSQL